MTIADSDSLVADDFKGCSTVEVVVLGNGLLDMDETLFRYLTALKEITLPVSLSSIATGVFNYCEDLETIYMLGSGRYYVSNNCLIDKDCKALVKAFANSIIPEDGSVEVVNTSAFYKCKELYDVRLPANIKSIEYKAFDQCGSITSIALPFVGHRASSASDAYFGYIFGATSEYEYQKVPAELTSIRILGACEISARAFWGCANIREIFFDSAISTIGESAFNGCTGLTRVDISCLQDWCRTVFENTEANPLYFAHNLYIDGTYLAQLQIPSDISTVVANAFTGCNIRKLTLTDNVKIIGERAFSSCSFLDDVELGHGLQQIGAYAFSGTAITAITIPDTAETVDYSAFDDCLLETATIPAAACTAIRNLNLRIVEITSGEIVPSHAFEGCRLLESVTFCNSIITVEGDSFRDCVLLNTICMGDSVETIGSSAFKN